jgi:hypothetical protein
MTLGLQLPNTYVIPKRRFDLSQVGFNFNFTKRSSVNNHACCSCQSFLAFAFATKHSRFLPSFLAFTLQGINAAEFEFPAYYNFFFKRKQLHIVCAARVEAFIRCIFQETLLGPKNIREPFEYTEKVPKEAYPDLAAEMAAFGKHPFEPGKLLTVDTLLRFTHFDEHTGVAELENEYVVGRTVAPYT